jgi:hypothetical protein
MKRHFPAGAGMVAVLATVALAPPASAKSGAQLFAGTLVSSGASGSRDIVSSRLFARGVLDGIGRVVEVANRPGDPDAVSRDDLVFKGGRLHLVSTSRAPDVSIDPATCSVTAHIDQTGKVVGGTRRFRAAKGTFKATVDAYGVAARNPDGSCSQEAALLVEADVIAAKGTLSF